MKHKKTKTTFATVLLVMLMAAPAAYAAPPGASGGEFESVNAEFPADGGFVSVSGQNFTETLPEGSFEGSSAFVGYFAETETGSVECFASSTAVGPTVGKKLLNGSLVAELEGACLVRDFSGVVLDEGPFSATVDLAWEGDSHVQRSHSHFNETDQVCKSRSASRDAIANGMITVQGEGVVDIEISSASSDRAAISRSSFSCHAKGSPQQG